MGGWEVGGGAGGVLCLLLSCVCGAVSCFACVYVVCVGRLRVPTLCVPTLCVFTLCVSVHCRRVSFKYTRAGKVLIVLGQCCVDILSPPPPQPPPPPAPAVVDAVRCKAVNGVIVRPYYRARHQQNWEVGVGVGYGGSTVG